MESLRYYPNSFLFSTYFELYSVLSAIFEILSSDTSNPDPDAALLHFAVTV